mmetsp:Transcript_111751/g.240958  ORF Transcript_111751/g.240958 Transcript_111751/m.240958 type:complete len:337 (-) Transcript_111751:665-1675(-)
MHVIEVLLQQLRRVLVLQSVSQRGVSDHAAQPEVEQVVLAVLRRRLQVQVLLLRDGVQDALAVLGPAGLALLQLDVQDLGREIQGEALLALVLRVVRVLVKQVHLRGAVGDADGRCALGRDRVHVVLVVFLHDGRVHLVAAPDPLEAYRLRRVQDRDRALGGLHSEKEGALRGVQAHLVLDVPLVVGVRADPVRGELVQVAVLGVLPEALAELLHRLAPPVGHEPDRGLLVLRDELHVAAAAHHGGGLDDPLHGLVEVHLVHLELFPLLIGPLLEGAVLVDPLEQLLQLMQIYAALFGLFNHTPTAVAVAKVLEWVQPSLAKVRPRPELKHEADLA